METGQAGLVLSYSPQGVPTNSPATHPTPAHHSNLATSAANCASTTCRSIQLCGWLRKLAGRLVGAEEGVVLSRPWQGLPEPGWWMRDVIGAVRLQCRVLELDGRLVSGEKSMVLFEQGQGMSSSSWGMRMMWQFAVCETLEWRWRCRAPSSGVACGLSHCSLSGQLVRQFEDVQRWRWLHLPVPSKFRASALAPAPSSGAGLINLGEGEAIE